MNLGLVAGLNKGMSLPTVPPVNSRLYVPASGSPIWVPETNEEAAGRLVNATSVGDAGNRSDHFMGTSMGAAWTSHGNATAVAKNSMANIGSTSGVAYTDRPFTPSGAFRIEYRARPTVASGGPAVLSTAGSDTGAILANFENAGVVAYGNSINTAHGTAGPGGPVGYAYYISIERNGSNVWTIQWSYDRALWQTVGSWSETLTITAFGVRGSAVLGHGYDFIDVVS